MCSCYFQLFRQHALPLFLFVASVFQSLISIIFKFSSTWSGHLYLCGPLVFLCLNCHSMIFLILDPASDHCMWQNHFIFWALIMFTTIVLSISSSILCFIFFCICCPQFSLLQITKYHLRYRTSCSKYGSQYFTHHS